MSLCSASVRLAFAAAVASGGALVAGAVPAMAHIGTSTDTVVAGASTTITFTVGHGCEGSPTTGVAFQLPESVVSAKPYAHPGWDIVVERAALDAPVDQQHGAPLTERPAVIRFSAQPGNELADEVRDEFAINVAVPDTPGETLFFKVVQTCVDGELPWIEEWDGQGDEPEHPAPSVDVVAAAAAGAVDEGPEAVTREPIADTAGIDSSDDDDSSNGLAIVGVVLGGLGVVAGGVALARTRRPAAS